MRFIRFTYGVYAIIALLFLLSISVLGDTIRLRDGSIYKGKIVSFAGGKFVVEIGEGARKRQLTFSPAEIDSIKFDNAQTLSEVKQTAQAPVRKDSIINVSTGLPKQTEKPSAPPKVVINETAQPARTTPKVVTDGTRSPNSTIPKVVADSKPTPTRTTPQTSTPSSTNGKLQPVELSVRVLADNTANGWTNSGWVVRKGQRIRISGDGQVSLGNGKTTTPAGLPDVNDNQKLLQGVATGALIAVIGDDNNEFLYIGSEREFTATRDGTLFLGVNEGNLNDNSGAFDVKIQITPDVN
jgi:hypothetical protein